MAAGKTTCRACGKDYAENMHALLYCLVCDVCYCINCYAKKKLPIDDEERWQCPSCEKWLSLEESRLFAQE